MRDHFENGFWLTHSGTSRRVVFLPQSVVGFIRAWFFGWCVPTVVRKPFWPKLRFGTHFFISPHGVL